MSNQNILQWAQEYQRAYENGGLDKVRDVTTLYELSADIIKLLGKNEATPEKPKNTRIQIELSENALNTFNGLCSSLHASHVEVIRDALKIYDWLSQETGKGAKIQLETKQADGSEKLTEIKLLGVRLNTN